MSVSDCPSQQQLRVLNSYSISALEQVCTLFSGIAYLNCWFLWKAVDDSWSENATHCPCACANFKCEFAHVSKEVSVHLISIQCVSVEYHQSNRENISWYIQLDWLAQQLFNYGPVVWYLLHMAASCHILWTPFDNLWHRNKPVAGTYLGLMSTVFLRKIYVLELIFLNYFFLSS